MQQAKVGNGCKGAGQLVLGGVVGVGAGAHGQHQVPNLEAFVAGAGGANADDGLDIVEVEKLIGVDGDGGNAHAMSHHAHGFAFVGARVAQHAADFIELYRVFQVALRHELDAQRVSGHDDKGCNLAFLGADMRGRSITHKGLLDKAGKVAGKNNIGY